MALDSPLTSDELQEALNSMPNKKAPGPDGFPAEFYKEFWAILATNILQNVAGHQKKWKTSTKYEFCQH